MKKTGKDKQSNDFKDHVLQVPEALPMLDRFESIDNEREEDWLDSSTNTLLKQKSQGSGPSEDTLKDLTLQKSEEEVDKEVMASSFLKREISGIGVGTKIVASAEKEQPKAPSVKGGSQSFKKKLQEMSSPIRNIFGAPSKRALKRGSSKISRASSRSGMGQIFAGGGVNSNNNNKGSVLAQSGVPQPSQHDDSSEVTLPYSTVIKHGNFQSANRNRAGIEHVKSIVMLEAEEFNNRDAISEIFVSWVASYLKLFNICQSQNLVWSPEFYYRLSPVDEIRAIHSKILDYIRSGTKQSEDDLHIENLMKVCFKKRRFSLGLLAALKSVLLVILLFAVKLVIASFRTDEFIFYVTGAAITWVGWIITHYYAVWEARRASLALWNILTCFVFQKMFKVNTLNSSPHCTEKQIYSYFKKDIEALRALFLDFFEFWNFTISSFLVLIYMSMQLEKLFFFYLVAVIVGFALSHLFVHCLVQNGTEALEAKRAVLGIRMTKMLKSVTNCIKYITMEGLENFYTKKMEESFAFQLSVTKKVARLRSTHQFIACFLNILPLISTVLYITFIDQKLKITAAKVLNLLLIHEILHKATQSAIKSHKKLKLGSEVFQKINNFITSPEIDKSWVKDKGGMIGRKRFESELDPYIGGLSSSAEPKLMRHYSYQGKYAYLLESGYFEWNQDQREMDLLERKEKEVREKLRQGTSRKETTLLSANTKSTISSGGTATGITLANNNYTEENLSQALMNQRATALTTELNPQMGSTNVELMLSKPEVNILIAISQKKIKFSLKDIHFKVMKGELVFVFGKRKSGSSSLLYALQGEMKISKFRGFSRQKAQFKEGESAMVDFSEDEELVVGKVRSSGNKPKLLRNGSVGLLGERRWVLPGLSIRRNIALDGNYSKVDMENALELSGLREEVERMEYGLETVVGEHYHHLDRAQTAKLILARIIYQDPDIILLDDLFNDFSDMESKRILMKCIDGPLCIKTRIITTSSTKFLSYADRIHIMDNGRIVAQGSYSEIQHHRIYKEVKALEKMDSYSLNPNQEDHIHQMEGLTLKNRVLLKELILGKSGIDWPDGGLTQVPNHAFGYCLLQSFGGVVIFVLYTLFRGIFCTVLDFYWIYNLIYCFYFTKTLRTSYLYTIVTAIALRVVVAAISDFLLAKSMISTTFSSFKLIITNLLHARIPEFWRLIAKNRLVYNLNASLMTLEQKLASKLQKFISTASEAIIGFLALTYVCNSVSSLNVVFMWLLIFAILLGINFWLISKIFELSRTIKSVELTANIKLTEWIKTSLRSNSEIRTLKHQNSVKDEFDERVNFRTSNVLITNALEVWIGLRIGSVSLILLMVMFAQVHYYLRTVDSFLSVFCFVCIVKVGNSLITFFGGLTDLDDDLKAIAIVNNFKSIEPDSNYHLEGRPSMVFSNRQSMSSTPSRRASDQPQPLSLLLFSNRGVQNRPLFPQKKKKIFQKGEIEFSNLAAKRHRIAEAKQDVVLCDITAHIQPEEKVLVIDKSSNLRSFHALKKLFWLDLDFHGRFDIDGTPVQSLDLKEYRKNISVISRDHLGLISPTIAQNLQDLEVDFEEEQVLEIFENLGLNRNELGIDGLKLNIGYEGSLVQEFVKKVYCVTKGILKSNKIVVIDSRNLQFDWDVILRQYFTKSTVLFLGDERACNIDYFDKKMVFDNGVMTKFGSCKISIVDDGDGAVSSDEPDEA